jgi:hypothetical protein
MQHEPIKFYLIILDTLVQSIQGFFFSVCQMQNDTTIFPDIISKLFYFIFLKNFFYSYVHTMFDALSSNSSAAKRKKNC